LNNPLLEHFDFPPFAKIEPRHVKPAIEAILQGNRQKIKELQEQQQISWAGFIQPLELLDEKLSRSWSPVRHLNSVKSSEELRQVYNDCLPMLSEYSTEIGQNENLYRAYQQLRGSDEYLDLSVARKKTIDDALLHFKLAGVALSVQDKQQYQAIQKRLSEIQSRFENNLLDATQAWELVLPDDSRLKGLPGYAKNMLKQYAEQKSLDGYRITLEMPCYIAVITYADDRHLREQIYTAFTTRASEQFFDKSWDNSQLMVEIVSKRQEKAKLLGFDNYAELSLQTKMAANVGQVKSFLEDLSNKAYARARQEFDQLRTFAMEEGLQDELQAWDVAYYSEKLKQRQYSISDEDLKPYFSAHKVLDGLLRIAETLFELKIEEVVKQRPEFWHDDVLFYRIDNLQGQVLGYFYLDLYARPNKRGGAWMDECLGRYVIGEQRQHPVAYLTCNLTPPIGDEPALFTHDEVITLFHEFGHGLHHMLTQVDEPEVSGINGVEWDAVELPSQFMENFCWQREALDLFARHYQTGEALPDDLYDKMIRAKNFQSAMQMQRQLEFSIFDIELHEQTEIQSAEQIQHILDSVRKRVAVSFPPAFNRFQNSFSHIFAGGYAAGYYSYKWAEVLSADAFSRFEEQGIFDRQTGQRFLQCILQQGGSRPARESFECFMGREPEIDALLRHNGIL
jgi:oligopeptidase A